MTLLSIFCSGSEDGHVKDYVGRSEARPVIPMASRFRGHLLQSDAPGTRLALIFEIFPPGETCWGPAARIPRRGQDGAQLVRVLAAASVHTQMRTPQHPMGREARHHSPNMRGSGDASSEGGFCLAYDPGGWIPSGVLSFLIC